MSLRSVLFWVHLTCGAVAGVIILLMSVTGVLLTYQRQMTAWFDMRSYRSARPSPGAAHLPIERLVAGVAALNGGDAPMTVTLRADPAAPASVVVGQKTLFVNPYTGGVLGEGAPEVRAFFRRVTDWHRWLGSSTEHRATARAITGAANLAFLVIVISGPFLWWPKRLTRTQVRNIAWFRTGLSPKARDFNWHNTLGIWSAIPLVVVVGSGVVMSYPWANNLVYRAAGEQPPAPNAGGQRVGEGRRGEGPDGRGGGRADGRGGHAGGGPIQREEPAVAAVAETPAIDRLIARAAAERPAWRTIAVRWPVPSRGLITLTVDEGDGGQPQKRGTLTLDPTTGSVVRWEGQAELSPGRRARSWLRFAHTGEVYGITGQTVAGLASLAGAVLVWTGLALAFRRCLAWRQRKRVAETGAAIGNSEARI
jgi:uncharacterized iron-regulated membrane protein